MSSPSGSRAESRKAKGFAIPAVIVDVLNSLSKMFPLCSRALLKCTDTIIIINVTKNKTTLETRFYEE